MKTKANRNGRSEATSPTPFDYENFQGLFRVTDASGHLVFNVARQDTEIGNSEQLGNTVAFVVQACNSFEANQAEIARLRDAHEALVKLVKSILPNVSQYDGWCSEAKKTPKLAGEKGESI